MKKIIISTLGTLMSFTVFAAEQSPNYPPSTPNPPWLDLTSDEFIVQFFSSNSLELIQAYAPRAIRRNTAVPVFTYFPHEKEKHYNDEYRPAWEELFREVVLDGVYAKRMRLNNGFVTAWPVHNTTDSNARSITATGLAAALSDIGSTNSIPTLVDVYTKLLEKDKNANQARKTDVLGVLLNINATESLDAVFSLLDLTENKLGAEPAATLREALVKDLEQALEKRESFKTYQNPNLSANNQALLEKARRKEPQP